jgi:hypothetical protein
VGTGELVMGKLVEGVVRRKTLEFSNINQFLIDFQK